MTWWYAVLHWLWSLILFPGVLVVFAGQFIDLLHEERKLVRLAIAGPSNGLNPMLPFSRNCGLILTR